MCWNVIIDSWDWRTDLDEHVQNHVFADSKWQRPYPRHFGRKWKCVTHLFMKSMIYICTFMWSSSDHNPITKNELSKKLWPGWMSISTGKTHWNASYKWGIWLCTTVCSYMNCTESVSARILMVNVCTLHFIGLTVTALHLGSMREISFFQLMVVFLCSLKYTFKQSAMLYDKACMTKRVFALDTCLLSRLYRNEHRHMVVIVILYMAWGYDFIN